MKELLVITYPNTKKSCYFTPISENLSDFISEQVEKWLMQVESKFITDEQVERLKTCTLDEFYRIIW